MKRFIYTSLLLILISLFIPAVYAQAAETETIPSHVNITIVMPESAPEPATAAPIEPEPEPKPAPSAPAALKLYPTDVRETRENGSREIIKTYELGAGERPADIPRDSFERDGWLYTLSDIIKKESSSADSREYIELVEQFSATNDTESILKLFDPSYEFINEDGYMGTMKLDISTLKVETAGTKTSSYTVTATREFPHLSSNDTSLIPKTVKDGGRTLTLSNIQWKTQNYSAVDYEQIPDSYTAVATYTGTAYKTAVTGYTATAEYRGTLSKIITGKTVYTAYFIGIEIVPEKIPVIPIENIPATENPILETETSAADEIETEMVTDPAIEMEPSPEPESSEETGQDEPSEKDSETNNNSPFIMILIVFLILIVGAGAGYFIPRLIKTIKMKRGEKYL